jgi:threonine synthase
MQEGKGAPINFSVPTGNFGDILAGYYCKRMGLPVGQLLVATNENDILHRFFTSGNYWREANLVSLSLETSFRQSVVEAVVQRAAGACLEVAGRTVPNAALAASAYAVVVCLCAAARRAAFDCCAH